MLRRAWLLTAIPTLSTIANQYSLRTRHPTRPPTAIKIPSTIPDKGSFRTRHPTIKGYLTAMRRHTSPPPMATVSVCLPSSSLTVVTYYLLCLLGSTLELECVQELQLLKTELAEAPVAAIRSNFESFERKFEILQQEMIDEMRKIVVHEGDRVISTVLSGPHDRIIDPVCLDILPCPILVLISHSGHVRIMEGYGTVSRPVCLT